MFPMSSEMVCHTSSSEKREVNVSAELHTVMHTAYSTMVHTERLVQYAPPN